MVYSLSAAEVWLKNRKDYHQKVGYNFHLSSRLKKSEKKFLGNICIKFAC